MLCTFRMYTLTGNYWVGASDLQVTGEFRWLNSGKVVSAPVSYWWPGEPNGGSEHCMHIKVKL